MDKNIKNLLIDFGGVLIDLDRSRCIESFKSIGFSHIEDLINPYYQQGIFMMLEKGEISNACFRDEIRTIIGKDLEDQQIDSAWNSFLINIPSYKLELLLQLRKKYNVFLLSNTNEIHWDWACRNSFSYNGLKVEDFFDRIFLSCRLHQVKPEKDIFCSLLEQTGIDPSESFFIDDAEANCETAAKLGIKSYMPLPREDWSHLFDSSNEDN